MWPIIGPDEIEMTRAYPFRQDDDQERTDHPHHRSLWFSHGDVNGIDFWAAPSDENRPSRGFGRIEHREFLKVSKSGDTPVIVTRNMWVDSRDRELMQDYRTIQFGATPAARWIDFDLQLFTAGDEPVKFGDTKEGCFGVRVAGWMKVDNGGRIVTNHGKQDKDAWGTRASWVDYNGARESSGRHGIAILNHPRSFRFPTYWHVRTYGLFAANVFGLHNFKNSDEEDGSYELQPGETLMFCYRVFLHRGDEQDGRVPEAFIDYAKVDKTLRTEEEIVDKTKVPEVIDLESAAGADEAVVTPGAG